MSLIRNNWPETEKDVAIITAFEIYLISPVLVVHLLAESRFRVMESLLAKVRFNLNKCVPKVANEIGSVSDRSRWQGFKSYIHKTFIEAIYVHC